MDKVGIKGRVGKAGIKVNSGQCEHQGIKQGQRPTRSMAGEVKVRAIIGQGVQGQEQIRSVNIKGWDRDQPKREVRQG